MNQAQGGRSLATVSPGRQDAIVRRWVAEILATYPAEAAAAFARERDPFANPVGRSVRAGARSIVTALCDGMQPEAIRSGVREIVQVRAVQQFSPSRAVGFVFGLKPLLLEGLRGEGATGGAGDDVTVEDLAAVDRAVDAVALAAFDVFTECREQVCQLRIEEQKRRVAWIVDHWGGAGESAEP